MRFSIIIGMFLLASPVAVAQVMDVQIAAPVAAPPKKPRVWRILGYGAGQLSVGDVSGGVESAISSGGALALGLSLTAPHLFDEGLADEAELQVFVRRGSSSIDSALSSPRDFGRSLLTPESTTTGFRLIGSWSTGALLWPGSPLLRDIGLQAVVDIGASDWKIQDPGNPDVDPPTVGAVSGFASPQLIWRTRSSPQSQNSFGFRFGIGPSLRWLGDSVANTAEFRQRALGTTTPRFWGVDSSFTIQLNQVALTPRFSYVFARENVEGLSGFQFFITATLLGGVSFAEQT